MLRRTIIPVLAVAATLASASSAWAVASDGGVELAGGSGRAVLSLRGASLGTLESGRITVTVRAGEPRIVVTGHEWQRKAKDGGTTYGGRDLRYRVFRGAWRLVIQGTGINASAVGGGIVGLRGTGRYSIDGASYEPWPSVYQTIRLGADR